MGRGGGESGVNRQKFRERRSKDEGKKGDRDDVRWQARGSAAHKSEES